MKLRPLGVELLNEAGQTDETKLIEAFRNFVKAAKMFGILRCSGMIVMRFVTEVLTFSMKVFPSYLPPVTWKQQLPPNTWCHCVTSRCSIIRQQPDHTYRIQNSKIIESQVSEIILLLK
jgi:hypothetical protein